jgi:hypothetical protein
LGFKLKTGGVDLAFFDVEIAFDRLALDENRVVGTKNQQPSSPPFTIFQNASSESNGGLGVLFVYGTFNTEIGQSAGAFNSLYRNSFSGQCLRLF